MRNRDENTDHEDGYLDDGAYDRYHGPDLSDDPLLQDDVKKKKGRKKPTVDTEAEETAAGSPQVDEAETKPKRKSRFSEYLMSVLSGNILSKNEVRKVYPYLLFIAFLAFLYIGNVFRMQSLHRKRDKLTIEVKELRAKSLTIASEKMRITRQSNIIKELQQRNIPVKESLEPNKVIRK